MTPAQRPDPPPGTAAHPIMFWVLTGLALAVFAPCVLVPIVVETEEIRAYERAVRLAVADLERQVQKNDARIEALRTDPLVNERILRRELNYRPETENVVQISSSELARIRVPADLLRVDPAEPAEPPHWTASVVRWLPAWPWRELFARSPNRTLLLAMSGGLLVAAFLLYGRPVAVRPASSRR